MSSAARQRAGKLQVLELITQGQRATSRIWTRRAHSGKDGETSSEHLIATKHDSSRSGKQDRFKPLSNPGMSREDFIKVFQSPRSARLKHKVYPLRWDWHLRMFLYCLVPPISLYIFSVVVDYIMLSDDEIVEILELEKVKEGNEADGRFAWFSGVWGWWNFGSIFGNGEIDESSENGKEMNDEKSTGSGIVHQLEKRLAKIEKQFLDLYKELEKRDEELERRMSQRKKEHRPEVDDDESDERYTSSNAKSADEIVAAARQISCSVVRPPS